MTNALMPSGYPGGYAAYYQQVIKPAEDAIQPATRYDNARSHSIGSIDDVARCVRCEVAAWNAWKVRCAA